MKRFLGIAVLGFVVALLAPSVGRSQPLNEGKFEKFKELLKGGYDVGALGFMNLSAPPDKARMKHYAEEQCAKKDQTACSVAYCGAGGGAEFLTTKCAQVMGRAYGEGWVEIRKRRDPGLDVTVVQCLKSKEVGEVRCSTTSRTCRHNLVNIEGSSVLGISGALSDIETAATDACSGKIVRK